MDILKISVNKASAAVTAGGDLTAGTVGALYEVTYDASWDKLGKVVVFSNGQITRNAVDGKIPWEVLAQPAAILRVGIVGRNKDGTVVIPTIWAMVGPVTAAAIESGDPNLDPENPVWAQSAVLAQQALDTAQRVEQRADNGEFQGIPGPQGEPYEHSPEFSALAKQVREDCNTASNAAELSGQNASHASKFSSSAMSSAQRAEAAAQQLEGMQVNSVRYDAPQDLTQVQQKQARSNIAALAQSDLQSGIDRALGQARDSGAFNGQQGPRGLPGENGPKGDKGADGTSAFQFAQSGGYGGTAEQFSSSLAHAAQLFEKDLSGWSPVVEMDGATEPWEAAYYWGANGIKVSTAYTKDYFASTKFAIQPNCSYQIHGLSGEMYLYDASGKNGIKVTTFNPTETLEFQTGSDRRFAAVSTKATGTWTPKRTVLTRTSISKEEYDALPSNARQFKPLCGKRIVCFGDSLFGMYRGVTSAPSYASLVCGAEICNAGFGGCRMARHSLEGYAPFSMWALAKAVSSGDWTSQDAGAASGSAYFPEQLAALKAVDFPKVYAAVIHYGTNDFAANIPLDSENKLDCGTICGALRYSLQTLQAAFPRLHIFVSLPVYRYWTEGSSTIYAEQKTNGNGIHLSEVCSALAAVAKEYHCPIIDGYHCLGISSVNATAFLEDGTHHNQYGRERFGTYIGQCLMSGGCSF